ncbi:pyruvate dehydrogenase protein X component, mitochondrial-like [Brevipalpus obovatus]|uniref:pyruvate dehydrogenase protein X component, mitochondrial-like n=1 Tax=Brevipalpus obovatus TaxID=246614 RepID=UPI003D9E719A
MKLCIDMVLRSSSSISLVRRLSSPSSVPSHVRIGPSVRNLLALYGLEATVVPASGPKNVLLKTDLLKYIDQKCLKPLGMDKLLQSASTHDRQSSSVSSKPQQQQQPQPVSQLTSRQTRGTKFFDVEVTGMRRTIAKRLTSSKTNIPHAYMTSTCCVDSLQRLRSTMKQEGQSVSLNDMIIKTTAVSLRKVSQVNGIWDESRSCMQIHPTVDISIAVATDSGLITPIIKSADILSVVEINQRVKDLAERARMNKLKPEEFQGGSFSISNLGMFGISHFTAVINPPQAAILAVGGIKVAVSVDEKPTQAIDLTLSFDSRCIDEETAAKFMSCLAEIISNPTMGVV